MLRCCRKERAARWPLAVCGMEAMIGSFNIVPKQMIPVVEEEQRDRVKKSSLANLLSNLLKPAPPPTMAKLRQGSVSGIYKDDEEATTACVVRGAPTLTFQDAEKEASPCLSDFIRRSSGCVPIPTAVQQYNQLLKDAHQAVNEALEKNAATTSSEAAAATTETLVKVSEEKLPSHLKACWVLASCKEDAVVLFAFKSGIGSKSKNAFLIYVVPPSAPEKKAARLNSIGVNVMKIVNAWNKDNRGSKDVIIQNLRALLLRDSSSEIEKSYSDQLDAMNDRKPINACFGHTQISYRLDEEEPTTPADSSLNNKTTSSTPK